MFDFIDEYDPTIRRKGEDFWEVLGASEVFEMTLVCGKRFQSG